MGRFEIEQTATGVILGVYEGETPDEAIRAMLIDAGAPDAEPDAGLQARELDDEIHAWDSEEYGFYAGETPTADDIDGYFTVENFLQMSSGLGTAPSFEEMAELRAAAHAALDDDEEPAR